MRVLILTGRFGMGHIAAAQALQQEILREDPTTDVTVLDVIETCLPQLRHLIYGCFDFTVNYCSGVYNVLNRVAGRYPRAPMRRAMIQKVTQLLAEHQSDLLISTLPMCSQYISDYKQVTGDPIPLYTYITDLDAHNEMNGWLLAQTATSSPQNRPVSNCFVWECLGIASLSAAFPSERRFSDVATKLCANSEKF